MYSREYRRKCLSEKVNECVACGSEGDLVVHHIDGDRTNHALENLTPMCGGCHKSVHTTLSDPRNKEVEKLRRELSNEKKVRKLNETFTDAELEALKEVKGDRTWRETILEEFGVGSDE